MRASGLLWGLPLLNSQYNFHPDEWPYLMSLYAFPHHIVFQKFLPYPTFLPYAINLMSPLHLFLGTISNLVNLIVTGEGGAVDFTWIGMKLIGRTVTVLMGTGSIVLVYAAMRNLYGRRSAIASAAFLAFSLYAVQNASFFTPAVPSSFFMLILIICGYRLYDSPSFASYSLAALATAMAAGVSYQAIVGALFIFIVHAQAAFRVESGWRRRLTYVFGKRLWFYAAISLATFVVISPGVLFHFKDVVLSVVEEMWRATSSKQSSRLDPYAWLLLSLKTIEMLGPWFAFLVVGSLLWNLIRLDRKTLPLIALPVICWLIFPDAMRPRHMVLFIPFYAMWTGRMIGAALSARSRALKYATVILFCVALGYSVYYNVSVTWTRYNDNRSIGAELIEKEMPPGSTVGIKCLEGGMRAYENRHYKEFMWDFPLVSPDRYELTDCLMRPQYLILSEYSDKYPLTAFDSGLLQNNVWPKDAGGLWWRERIPSPELIALYRELLTDAPSCYMLTVHLRSRQTEYAIFKLYYDISELRRIDWKEIRRLFMDPNGFYSFEYPSPDLRIYKLRDDCDQKGGLNG